MIAAPLIALSATACAAPAQPEVAPPVPTPADRSASVATTGCGLAADRAGAGIAIGGNLVVTVAHLVVQSEDVTVTIAGRSGLAAEVLAVDLTKDMAVMRLPDLNLTAIETRQATVGVTGSVATGLDPAPFRVTQNANISIEEVLGTTRHERRGYAIDAATDRGDSGAGAYDDAGALIGMVFAFSEDPKVTWLTSSEEIMDFVASVDTAAPALACDPALSRLALP